MYFEGSELFSKHKPLVCSPDQLAQAAAQLLERSPSREHIPLVCEESVTSMNTAKEKEEHLLRWSLRQQT